MLMALIPWLTHQDNTLPLPPLFSLPPFQLILLGLAKFNYQVAFLLAGSSGPLPHFYVVICNSVPVGFLVFAPFEIKQPLLECLIMFSLLQALCINLLLCNIQVFSNLILI
jgi:hypothetical protein